MLLSMALKWSPFLTSSTSRVTTMMIPLNLSVNQDTTTGFYIDDSTALETLYRLNVGGEPIPPINDSGMFRSWITDYPYATSSTGLTPPYKGGPIHYTAPETVYSSARIMENFKADYNLTWIFSVDSGFLYLLRFYFCEYQPEVTEINQRVFSIFITNKTAEPLADVIEWSKGNRIPVYKDYVVFILNSSDGTKGKQKLWLALHPNNETIPDYSNTILNGLEIFKLIQMGGSLPAAPNPDQVPSPAQPTEISRPGNQKSGTSNYIFIRGYTGGAVCMTMFFLVIGGFVLYRQRRQKSLEAKLMWDPQRYGKSRSTGTNNSSLSSVKSKKFSLELEPRARASAVL